MLKDGWYGSLQKAYSKKASEPPAGDRAAVAGLKPKRKRE
jgi:hypothetical protein